MTPLIRRQLFTSPMLRVTQVAARPTTPTCSEVERQGVHVLVLPVSGLFALHDSPRHHRITTPNHALMLAAESPHRFGFPGCVGDDCLSLVWPSATWAELPAPRMTSLVLAPAAVTLGRSLLWRRFAAGEVDPLEVEELAHRLLALTMHSAATARRCTARSDARARRAVERVKEAIAVDPQRRFSLGELAALVCFSPHHLAHVFSAEVGSSLYRYALRARLVHSLDAVLETSADLTDVALDAGFSSHSHFTARFRAWFGITPQALRRSANRSRAAQLRKIVTAPQHAAA